MTVELLNAKLMIKHGTAQNISLSAIEYLEIIKICKAMCKYSLIMSQACSSVFILMHICLLRPKESKHQSVLYCVKKEDSGTDCKRLHSSTFPLSTFTQPSTWTHISNGSYDLHWADFKYENSQFTELLFLNIPPSCLS